MKSPLRQLTLHKPSDQIQLVEVHWPVPRLSMSKANNNNKTLSTGEATGQSFTGRQQQKSHTELREPWTLTHNTLLAVYLN